MTYIYPNTYNDERRVIETILAIDVYTLADELLTSLQIAMSTRHEELIELGALVKRILLKENATLDEPSFFAELSLKFEFAENHC
jgi:hypothetical protein